MRSHTEPEHSDRHIRRQLARINASLVVRSGLYRIIDENQQRIVADKLSLADVQRWTAGAIKAARNTIDAPTFQQQVDIHQGNALSVLRRMESESVQCCVTSPPYFQHRDYHHPGQLGQERTPDRYVDRLVAIMEEVRRVLKKDGTAWLVLGDGYNSNPSTSKTPRSHQGNGTGKFRIPAEHHHEARRGQPNRATPLIRQCIKKKDVIGIPWRVAFALRDAGWYLRSAITWEKINPMPENVRDRPTQSTEMVFLLSKSGRYLFNRDAVPRGNVWSIRVARLPRRFAGRHFAVMPVELARRCILAGSDEGDTVLDSFSGSGTTALAARLLNRHATMIEINPDYIDLMRARLAE